MSDERNGNHYFIGAQFVIMMVVSFSVTMVDFANRILEEARQKERPKTVRQAIVEVSALRLRPILMVALDAILGLTPSVPSSMRRSCMR